jgi:putative phosphoribosyl transferase
VVCLDTPDDLDAVSTWYEDFEQTSDAEVRELLAAARAREDRAPAAEPHAST